jgi:hypothetical protein
METDRNRRERTDEQHGAEDRRECGCPGGGQGRRDEIEPSGVYPLGADNIPPDAEIRMAGSWGGGDYNEAGGSELIYWNEILLGGLTAGPNGEPTIDIHGGEAGPSAPAETAERGGEAESSGNEAVRRNVLLLRGLPPAEGGEPVQDSGARP